MSIQTYLLWIESTNTHDRKHNYLNEDDWIVGCRVDGHKEPTWYFSFMGRKDKGRFPEQKTRGQAQSKKATNGSSVASQNTNGNGD